MDGWDGWVGWLVGFDRLDGGSDGWMVGLIGWMVGLIGWLVGWLVDLIEAAQCILEQSVAMEWLGSGRESSTTAWEEEARIMVVSGIVGDRPRATTGTHLLEVVARWEVMAAAVRRARGRDRRNVDAWDRRLAPRRRHGHALRTSATTALAFAAEEEHAFGA